MNRNARRAKKSRLIGTRIGAKLLGCVFLSLIVAIGCFAMLYFLSGKAAENYSRTRYASLKLDEFQRYVDEKDIRSDSFTNFTAWLNKNDIKFMHIYEPETHKMVFNSDDPVDDSYSYDEREASYYWAFRSVTFIKDVRYVLRVDKKPVPTNALMSSGGGEEKAEAINSSFPLKIPGQDFAKNRRDHGTYSFSDIFDRQVTYEALDVYIAVGTNTGLFIALLICSAFICLVVFAVLILRLSSRRVMYLTELSHEVASIEDGNIDKIITVRGRDEIGELAQDVENMRQSLVERLQSEKEAYDANRELITAMSHDIRTPLSALIGYLELVDGGVYASDEQKKTYIRKSVEKAYQLKSMSDKLFDYFTVFREDSAGSLTMEIFDGQELLMQMVSEQNFTLEQKGFTVETEGFDKRSEYRLNLDSGILLRVFDNIYSNIIKYADRKEPVRVVCNEDEAGVRLTVSNKIDSEAVKVASTRIGMKSCRRLMVRMGGALKVGEESGIYSATLILRKYRDNDEKKGKA